MTVPESRKQAKQTDRPDYPGSDAVTATGARGFWYGPAVLFAGMMLLLPAAGLAQGSAAPADVGLDSQQTTPAAASVDTPQSSPAAPAAGAGAAIRPASGGGSVDSTRYIIGSDDVLQVTVWKEPTLSGTVPVRPDGMISMVLLGDVPATGMTPMQLGNNITDRLKKYIQDPSVTVVVTAVNSQKIFLIGEVQHVGPISMTPGMTPLQAVSAGGGLTNFANSKKIYILRGGAGKQEKIPFNYKQALKGDSRQLVELHPGDTIVVP